MDYKKADDQCHVSEKNIEETESDIEELKKVLSEMGIPIERSVETDDSDAEVDDGIGDINNVLSEIVEPGKLGGSLDLTDVLVAIVAGVIASLIDIIFVGAPEVVKIYRSGEDFNGSMLTEALRKIGNTDNSKIAPILDKLCKICSVPYDIIKHGRN
jgi:hypothetical protein